MKKEPRQRLDVALTERGLAASRQKAQALIMAGVVLVNKLPATKAGALVLPEDIISLRGEELPYVSRGGLKMAGAFKAFSALSARDKVCMDVGASTGGFTDCLLQNGAAKVYAIDVGYGQLAWKLRQDQRVVVIERTNIRYMEPAQMPEKAALAVTDVSFISLKLVLPAMLPFIEPKGQIMALIKPQFEVGKELLPKGGVVRDPKLHTAVVEDIRAFAQTIGLVWQGCEPSPLLGPKGNREFLAFMNLT